MTNRADLGGYDKKIAKQVYQFWGVAGCGSGTAFTETHLKLASRVFSLSRPTPYPAEGVAKKP